ncbi:hypothetical protein BDV38DRAFT_278844 [Aspergillus pseudotamarii]|uniref:Uncharacterized protein n=1 Tax=Aspergillus pseudotamarii TaxID=132259 RepID=A0A5N6T5G4_ASPPS|nr:uncharacterized protein BDV38DRAFT_278844 [Aspergillus pseudotamarii]KAE8141489.1 hypothetical protein BDV38DRAFT_278844 [Aspergillus pseudotamarii]
MDDTIDGSILRPSLGHLIVFEPLAKLSKATSDARHRSDGHATESQGVFDIDRERYVGADQSAVNIDGLPSRSNSFSIRLATERDDHRGAHWATSAVVMAEQSATRDQSHPPLNIYSDVRFGLDSDWPPGQHGELLCYHDDRRGAGYSREQTWA